MPFALTSMPIRFSSFFFLDADCLSFLSSPERFAALRLFSIVCSMCFFCLLCASCMDDFHLIIFHFSCSYIEIVPLKCSILRLRRIRSSDSAIWSQKSLSWETTINVVFLSSSFRYACSQMILGKSRKFVGF